MKMTTEIVIDAINNYTNFTSHYYSCTMDAHHRRLNLSVKIESFIVVTSILLPLNFGILKHNYTFQLT